MSSLALVGVGAQAQSAPANMVAAWTLDDTLSGYVDPINGLVLAPVGSGITTGLGVIGPAAAFGGAGWLATPDSAALRAQSGFAAELWLYWTGDGASGRDVYLGKGTEWGIHIRTPFNQLRVYAGAAVELTSGAAIVKNTWYHSVLTFDGTTVRQYTNGALTQSAVATPGNSTAALTVGNGNPGYGPATGRADEVRIWQFGAGVDPGAAFWLARYNAGAGRRL